MQLLPREEEMCSLMNFTPEERCELQCPDMESLAEKVSVTFLILATCIPLCFAYLPFGAPGNSLMMVLVMLCHGHALL
jgi:hypothetical protein